MLACKGYSSAVFACHTTSGSAGYSGRRGKGLQKEEDAEEEEERHIANAEWEVWENWKKSMLIRPLSRDCIKRARTAGLKAYFKAYDEDIQVQ